MVSHDLEYVSSEKGYSTPPNVPSGRVCRRCGGALWVWEPGPNYPIAVCDGCLEVTLPPGAMLFDSGHQYAGAAEELRAVLAKARGRETPGRLFAGAAVLLTSSQPADCAPAGGLASAPEAGTKHRSGVGVTDL
jgi:hypothetical protein